MPAPDSKTTSRKATRRLRVRVAGVVQGVGFRPFVYGLAARLRLGGFVLNNSRGVEIEIEGDAPALDEFLRELKSEPPPLAVIQGVEVENLEPAGGRPFEIRMSESLPERSVLIPPDYATCADCLREIFDPADRRYRYPFTNCTRCGPRYTIIRDLPYDRSRTTMSAFAMCPACRAEYENPLDRRFHAEPTCCPECGPHVWLAAANGALIACDDPVGSEAAIAECARLLREGRILAIKGLGGFHLACDAANDAAVRELRRRKEREEKPFAIMAPNMEAVKRMVFIPDEQKRILAAKERPILLLPKRPGGGVSELVAPKSANLGVMLPYMPLHYLLMHCVKRTLVMTSGNPGGEAITHRNEAALERLKDIADGFLLHNRDIHIPTDDSVARVAAGGLRFIRRSRGYAPFPVELPAAITGFEILAVGPELKNTVCLTRGQHAFLSHHVGDLKNLPAYEAFVQAVEHLRNTLQIAPRAVACDMHPDYMSTRFAARYANESRLELVAAQHHHAHVASVLAEKKRTDRVIGVSFDGLGWGEAGEVWGGEFLVCDLGGYERAGWLELAPQPGGDAVTRFPRRMAYVFLRMAYCERAEELAIELLPSLSADERNVIAQMIEHGVNTPLTSSAGRLFDAASALLGICEENTHEGQAPMELEAAAETGRANNQVHTVHDVHTVPYPAAIDNVKGRWVVRTRDIIRGVVEDFRGGTAREMCAARFHDSLAHCVVEVCGRIREQSRLSTVALSGGVFASALLLEKVTALLNGAGFEVLANLLVPAGDGGVCLGQAAIAAWRISRRKNNVSGNTGIGHGS